jgi:hypothetical protein
MMTRCAFTFLLCACASFFLNAQVAELPPEHEAPVITFDSTTYWFDTVYQGSNVDHEFRFRNTGKTPLIISSVTGSSGSIVPYYPKEPIAPGQSSFIRVVYNTTSKMGPQSKTVTVISNASEPVLVLQLKGIVVVPLTDPNAPVLQFDSPVFSFDTIDQGTIVTHEYRFINKGKSPLIITDVTTNCGCLVPEFPKEPVLPGGTGIVRLTFYSAGKSGMQYKMPTVHSNSGYGAVVIHMKGFVKVPPPTNK